MWVGRSHGALEGINSAGELGLNVWIVSIFSELLELRLADSRSARTSWFFAGRLEMLVIEWKEIFPTENVDPAAEFHRDALRVKHPVIGVKDLLIRREKLKVFE